jgi:hypothetical protein
MSETVWISKIFSKLELELPMSHSFIKENISFAIECGQRNHTGEPLDATCFPEEVWPNPDSDKAFRKLPDIFFAASYWIVSKACADVLRQFDLGRGALYPVRVLNKDHLTPIPGEYFCINFGNVKQAFLPEQSQNIRVVSGGAWRTRAVYADGDIACSSEALSGADIWIDPSLRGALFLSDALGRALVAAKASSGFGEMIQCRIVQY